MKKIFKQVGALAIFTTTFFLLSSFTLQNTASSTAKSYKPNAIHISINYYDGTFTCSGAVNTSGSWTMDTKVAGVTFHCINTLYAQDGSTLVAISHCNGKTSNGIWQIKSGTGVFANMKGNGRLVMYEATEEWDGAVR